MYFDSREGNIFTVDYRAEGEADNGTIKISFKIPSAANGGKQVKLFPIFSASGADYAGAQLEVIKNPTLTLASGTQKAVKSMCTDGNAKSIVTDVDGVANTVTTDATSGDETDVRYSESSGCGATGGQALVMLNTPILLKVNEDYTVKVTADTADTTLHLTLIWQEV